MAKTFDNISEASATNYLFLFAQKTLGLQNEAPTPPPLNALGLPCEAMCLLWVWLHPNKVHPEQAPELEEVADPEGRADVAAGGNMVAAETVAAETVAAAAEKAGTAELKAAAAKAAADNAQVSAGSVSSKEATQGEGTLAIEDISGEEATAVKAVAVDGQDAMAAEASPSSPPPSPSSVEVTRGEETPLVKEKTFAEKMAPLAEKITEYILDHQDDAAQEDRWRTTMKRAMSKSFRLQREESGKQREAIDRLDNRFDMQREAIDAVRQLVEDLANANQH